MLTAAGCRRRRDRLWDQLDPRPDWVLIADPQHLVYLANYYPSPFVFRGVNSGAVLILGADGSSILAGDNQLKAFAQQAHVDEVLLPAWYEGKKSAPNRGELLLRTVLERMQRCPGGRIGCEAAKLPAGIIEGLRQSHAELELSAVDDVLWRMKRQKDADEMDCMRLSMRAGSAAHLAALAQTRPGMTELDVYLLVEQAAMREAGRQAVVYGDFVSGPRTGQKGGPPSERVIEKGDLVLLDFSVVVNGYRGDFANTFVCGAKPSGEQRLLFEACLAALAAGERLVRAGAAARDIDQAVRHNFAGQGLAEHFISHSGHGLGLGHPDPPYLVPESTDTLLAGDVVAIEPGQYTLGESGMRFEHNYLVTDGGYEVLSEHALQIEQL